MIIYKLNKDLTDSAVFYWIEAGNGQPEENCSFGIQDYLSEGRILYPVDSEVYQQMIWPRLKKEDKKKINQLRAVSLDPHGSQNPVRTTWIPANAIEIAQI